LHINTNKMEFNRAGLSDEILKTLYTELLYPRLIEEKMLILLRQGKISKWFSGIGQEAISVGVGMALDPTEVVFPMHRNLGIFTTRKFPLTRLFSQWQGKSNGFSKGRERSFHFGSMEYNVVGMISHLGPQLSLAGGVALAEKIKGQKKISVAFTGEGGTSQGEFHEALNVAAVWKLPVIFVIENNGYGLSTPTSEQYVCDSLASKGQGYGMKSLTIDGNNVLEVYQTVSRLAEQMRQNPEPVLLECLTFRMRGHEEASGTKYVPGELMDHWAQKDPIANFESFLLDQEIILPEEVDNIKRQIKTSISSDIEEIYGEAPISSEASKELEDVYAPFEYKKSPPSMISKDMRFVNAISDGLEQAMLKWPDLVLMGQDIAEYGGVFKITEGFLDKFGKERVRNTPLCESAIVGAALGLSIRGIKSMVEMQFSDFVTCGFNQIVNNLAKMHYRWGQNADVVIRMPSGGTVGAGPFHSQTTEAWFGHVPGLKIVYPSTPEDAKGLLLTSFEDPNPIMFFEHKALYRSVSGPVPEGYYTIPFGQAKTVRFGEELTIITYGLGVRWAEEAVETLKIQADILDLRTLVPLDYDAIAGSVSKTGKVLVLHEDSSFMGFGAEISAFINENLFEHLDAPVMRCAALDTPIPFAKELEEIYMPNSRITAVLQKLINY
jgi:2-oxoisovalerate dehydrogenase E1 component